MVDQGGHGMSCSPNCARGSWSGMMLVSMEGLLPRVLPPTVAFELIPYEGKTDLRFELPW